MVNIYGIFNKNTDVCIYVGSSERDVEIRAKEHLTALKSKAGHSNRTLQKEFDKDNNVEVRLISSLDTNNSLLRSFYEMLYISAMKPKCNKCVLQNGNNRIVMSRCDSDVADKLIEYMQSLV